MQSILVRYFLISVLFSASLSGCAAFSKCGIKGCPGDAEITQAVKDEIDGHRDLGAVANFNIKTLDGVVYISGKVDTDLQKQAVTDVVSTVAGVKRVVNSVYTNNAAI